MTASLAGASSSGTAGDYLITIRFDNPGLAEDSVEDTFLKPHLEKYPSTM